MSMSVPKVDELSLLLLKDGFCLQGKKRLRIKEQVVEF